ncbi:magnesium chelatase ATPase subunit D, partial [Mameliella alba]
MTTAPPDWIRARRVLAALAVDPAALGGMVIRARPGPVRQRLEDGLEVLPLPLRRIHPGLDDIQLFGGLDVAASLAGGGLVRQPGLAKHAAALVMPMAERVPPGLAARLAWVLDGNSGHCLVLLDEGADPDETAPQALTDRLAFHLDLSEIRATDALLRLPAPADMDAARAHLPRVEVPDEHLAQLVHLAARFGIHGLRAPLLTLRCARALAALDLRDRVTSEHLREAAELVLPSRATQIPQAPDENDSPDPPRQQENEAQGDGAGMQDIPDELLVEAIAAILPPDLLTRLDRGGSARGGGQGFGAGGKRKGNRRGRPLPSRPGRPDGRARIDVV